MITLGIASLPPVQSIAKVETRTTPPEISWDALRGGIVTGVEIVNWRLAENLSTVLACVNVISRSIASLPTYVYRTAGKGRTLEESGPIARLIAEGPNRHQSWPDFIEWLLSSVLLTG